MRPEAATVHALCDPHGFNPGGGVALMVVEIGECGGAAVGLFAVPDADVVRIGSRDEQQARAERLVPVGRRAEFVDGNVSEARGHFAVAKGAGGMAALAIGDAGKGLAVALRGAIEARDKRCTVRRLPVGARCVTDEACRVDLVGRAVVARIVEAVGAHEEAKRAAVVLGEQQSVLAVHIACGVDGAALRRGFLDEPVGTEQPAGSEQTPGPAFCLEEQAGVVGSLTAVAGADFAWRDVGRAGITLMTPPMALEPYRSLAPPRTSSTLWMASSGCSCQWIHPPMGSLSGTSSSVTSVRLAEVEPRPRRLTPCEVGFATSELERRNSSRPGIWRIWPSRVTAAAVARARETVDAW